MRNYFLFISVLVAAAFSSNAGITNKTEEIVFSKETGDSGEVTATKKQIPYVPLTKEEKEKRLAGFPPGAELIEPVALFQYEVIYVHGKEMRKLWTNDHAISPLANIPQQVTIYDATITNGVAYLLIRVNEMVKMETIQMSKNESESKSETTPVCKDFTESGNSFVSGRLVASATNTPAIELRDQKSQRYYWILQNGKWTKQ